MANIEINAITSHFKGKVGDVVFRRRGDGVFAALRPRPSRVEPTAAIVAHRATFANAIRYAKGVMADPVLLEVYTRVAEMKEGQSAFNVAVADFFRPPKVTAIDVTGYTGHVGDRIAIEAQDDVDVMSVRVVIAAPDGTVLERGDAAVVDKQWVYTATTTLPAGQPVTIEATATDRPKHTGMLTTAFPLPG